MSCVYFAAILTILPPSWRQKRYCLLYIMGHGPVRARKLQFGRTGQSGQFHVSSGRVGLQKCWPVPSLPQRSALDRIWFGLDRDYNRDDHYLVGRLDIRQDCEFATGYGYPKTAFKRESDTEPNIRNAFIDIFSIQTFEKVAHCTIIHLLSSVASFKPSVP